MFVEGSCNGRAEDCEWDGRRQYQCIEGSTKLVWYEFANCHIEGELAGCSQTVETICSNELVDGLSRCSYDVPDKCHQ